MNMRSAFLAPVFILFLFLRDLDCEKFDVQKFLDEHGNCNGGSMLLPPLSITGILLAGSKCLDVTENMCAQLCVAWNYEEFIKDRKVNAKFVKDLYKSLDSPKNEKAKQFLVDSIEGCVGPNPPELSKPTSSTESCPGFALYQDCMEEKFKVACRGQKSKSYDSFMNS